MKQDYIEYQKNVTAIKWDGNSDTILELQDCHPSYEVSLLENPNYIRVRIPQYSMILTIGDYVIVDENRRLNPFTKLEFEKRYYPKP